MTNELQIPIVYENGSVIGYGGNQEWFSDVWKRTSGCGCTSGVNLAAYYASTNARMRNLYKGSIDPFNRREYVEAMDEMFTMMKPGFMGYPYIKKFTDQFIRFCNTRGVSLEAQILATFHSSDEAFAYVKDAIDSGNPIALLILLHRAKELQKDNWHWLTITGYIDPPDKTEPPQIIVSNYGTREVVQSKVLFDVHRKNKLRMVRFFKQHE